MSAAPRTLDARGAGPCKSVCARLARFECSVSESAATEIFFG